MDLCYDRVNIFIIINIKNKSMAKKSFLYQAILDFPGQLKEALEFSKDVKIDGEFERLIVCGMGGSALPADIIQTYLESKGIVFPIFVSRNYHLPAFADKKSLIFVSSYSGNTEETLSCFEEAKAKGFKIVGFAKGGKLERQCKESNFPFVKYPDKGPLFQPRFGLGLAFASMMSVLSNSKMIPDLREEMESLGQAVLPLEFEEQGKKLARKSRNSIPIFYSGDRYGESVARICKIMVNENAKTQAFYNVFPELNHNEMVGFTKLFSKFHLIILKDPDDRLAILKRTRITGEILKRKKGVLVSEIVMPGNSVLEKIFNTLIIGLWFSYYLAGEYQIDPIPVKMVEDFKKAMEK